MRLLGADETELVGRWLDEDGALVPDLTCERIEWLVREVLRPLDAEASGWRSRLSDPADGRIWELSYPQSSAHGGGPPTLRCVGQL